MKHVPHSILMDFGNSMFGRVTLLLTALIIGICLPVSIAVGSIFIPKEIFMPEVIIEFAGFAFRASIVDPIFGTLFASELILAMLFLPSKGRFWILGGICVLAALHTYYFIRIMTER